MHNTRRPWMAQLAAISLLIFAPSLCSAQATDNSPTLAELAKTPTVFDDPSVVERYQSTITPNDLAAHLYFFASDLFEGRETATRGQELAANYLASQYRKMGLTPKGNAANDNPLAPQAYFQPFKVYGQRLDQASLIVKNGGQTIATSTTSPTDFNDQAYFAFGTIAEATGGLVFGGYGISDNALGYDDYAALEAQGLDYSDKWLMLLRDEPLSDAETSLLPTDDHKPSQWTTNQNSKFRALFQKGLPRGILVVGDSGPREAKPMAERAKAAMAAQKGVGNLSLKPGSGGFQFPPFYIISSEMADKILAPSGRNIADVQSAIDENLKPVVFEAPGITVESTVANELKTYTTENVAAFIEGSDPVLKNQVVILSAHYDHIGMNPNAEGDKINNGADDDGSGTVAVLEMAEAFAKARADGFGPRRSVLFLNVTGEEKGLLGSAHFADEDPLVPLESVVTDLNIDMIGRHDPTHPTDNPNYVYIIGSNLISKELDTINKRVNKVTGTDLELNERFNTKDDPNQFYRRSDHWNFGKHGIPFIFFFTGTHEDYHKPGDEPQKIDYDRMATIAQLIFGTAWQVANQDAPPAVSGQGFN